jgi:hypothetical protein
MVLCSFVAGVFLFAGSIAALCRHLTKRTGLSVTIGTLTQPSLICALLVYWLMTMEVDDAPPGVVVMGSLTLIAVITPVSFFASRLTTRFLDRRALQNGS